jgi:formylglycine-generating enzyme required for sulfatase activity
MNRHHTISTLLALLIVAASPYAARSPADEPAKAEKPAADSMLGKEAGDVRDDNGLSMKLVWCLPGTYKMQHERADGPDDTLTITPVPVLLSRGYWLGRFETTQAEWKRLMGTEPWKDSHLTNEGPDYPATSVSWVDAMEFCRKLTEQERKAGRLPDTWEYTLPTEAQWERACRAQTETAYGFGDDTAQLGEYAWFADNARHANEYYAHRVGLKRPNPWGLYDMHGNAHEWCRDYFVEALPGGRDPEVVEKPPGPRTFRVVRGGGRGDDADDCRSSRHNGNDYDERNVGIGFRIALCPVMPAK